MARGSKLISTCTIHQKKNRPSGDIFEFQIKYQGV